MTFFQIIGNWLLDVFLTVIGIILTPINLLLGTLIPNYNNAIQTIADFIDYLSDFINFVMSWIHIPAGASSFILAYLIFIITIKPVVYGAKLIIKWFRTIHG